MLNKKYLLGIILIFFLVLGAASAVDAVSAAKYKKFDSGKYAEDGTIVKWNSYYNGKTVKMNAKIYFKVKKKQIFAGTFTVSLVKVSKTKIKITGIVKQKGQPIVKDTNYKKTRLNAKSYYYKEIKKSFSI